jgi:hypothetical protein
LVEFKDVWTGRKESGAGLGGFKDVWRSGKRESGRGLGGFKGVEDWEKGVRDGLGWLQGWG